MENPMRIPESWYFTAEELDQIETPVMRVLDEFEDVPGFISLKKFFIRPFFVNSEATADTLDRLYHFDCHPTMPHDCSEIRVFAAMLDHMTHGEKVRNAGPLVDMFGCLMARHRIIGRGTTTKCYCYGGADLCTRSFVPLCIERFRDNSEELVRLVTKVLGMQNKLLPGFRKTKILKNLLLCTAVDVDCILTCFSDERFHAWGIRETDFLMVALYNNYCIKLSDLLIRNGFKYSYYEAYYVDCCRKLKSIRTVYDGPPMKAFMKSGNLRRQMASEILVHLLCEDGRNREHLCTLWQSVPDPFITPDELYHLMEPIFARTSVLVDACERYCDVIPEVPPVKQPRSLKHLVRVRIRESMVRAHSIGEKAVRSQGLPKTLEEYLWKLEAF